MSITTVGDTSTRLRILQATAEVIHRNGKRKLSLSDVAAQAGVSRPTLYRWYPSKEELLAAYSRYERQSFDHGLYKATAGFYGVDRLDAALRFIVDYQQRCPGAHMVDTEPEYVVAEFTRLIPSMRAALQRLMPGPGGAVRAATAIRVATSHYMVHGDDADQFLCQLRYAVGIMRR